MTAAATFCTPLLAGDAPLSAIAWLSDSVMVEPAAEGVTVRTLPQPQRAVGTIGPEAAGIRADVWAGSTGEDLAHLLQTMPVTMPAELGDLLAPLIGVRAPANDPEGDFLLARLDILMAMGRLAEARALTDDAGEQGEALFRRAFDIALLTGDEDAACARFRARPDLSPTYPARVFCLARLGDWQAAALTLETAEALEVLTADESVLLGRFLDDGEGDLLPPPRRPDPVTPLAFRLYEAIGDPLSTRRLPLAFAHADLRPQNGWKTRLDAAERLYRAGAIPRAGILAVYLENAPAASGGVWDRVAVVQDWQAATPDEREAMRAQARDVLAPAGLERLIAEATVPAPAPGAMPALPDPDMVALIAAGRHGEAALTAIARIATAWDGDPEDLAKAVAALRAADVLEIPPGVSQWASR